MVKQRSARLGKQWVVWTLVVVALSGVLGAQYRGDDNRERVYQAIVNGLAGDRQTIGQELSPQSLDLGATSAMRDGVPLALAAVTWDAVLERWEFRLRCHVADDCIPFLVTARIDKSAGLKLRGKPESSGESWTESKGAAPGLGKVEKKAPVVAAGENATVVLAESSLHITAQVVCLERGVPGQWIRVRMRDGRARVFRAQVVSAGWLVAERRLSP